MPFEILKDDGKIQLDDMTQIMTYVGRYVMPGNTWGALQTTGGTASCRGTLTLPNTIKALFVENTNGAFFAVRRGVASGSNTVFHLIADMRVDIVLHGYTDRTLENNNYGLQLFDEDGTMTFDSVTKFLRINKIVTPTGFGSISYGGIGRYAVGAGNNQTYIIAGRLGPAMSFRVMNRAIRVYAGGFDVGLVQEQGPPVGSFVSPSPVPPFPPFVISNIAGY